MLVAIVISLGVMGGINENKCDYNLQEATVAMTYAAGTGEYGPEASGKLAVGALAMGKVTKCFFGFQRSLRLIRFVSF